MSRISISKHAFSDVDVYFSFASEDSICLSFRDNMNPYESIEGILNKEDVIALAKHFKLDANDLNTD